jgi:lipoyl synthase
MHKELKEHYTNLASLNIPVSPVFKTVKPSWFAYKPKTDLNTDLGTDRLKTTKQFLGNSTLSTVCESAKCPNKDTCWSQETATILAMGGVCTRGCKFCNISDTLNPEPLDPQEANKISQFLQEFGFDYYVVTMVDRDDIADHGVSHMHGIFSKTPYGVNIEFLSGDFQGNIPGILHIMDNPCIKVFAHNIETVERLTPKVRDLRASYRQSLYILEQVKKHRPDIYTKTSIMLGFGESFEDIYNTLIDLRAAKVDIVTFGQYLQPSKKHLSVKEYLHPQVFAFWQETALSLGFRGVRSGPLVRSSFEARKLYETIL